MLHKQIARNSVSVRSRAANYPRRLQLVSQPCIVCRRASAQPGDSDAGPSSSSTDDLPPELQDLAINEDGLLIDTKSGKVINEMGATRFDVAVRALRGELDPPEWVENSERTSGVILSALYQFPRPYLFQIVGRPASTPGPASEAASQQPPGEGGSSGGGAGGSKAAFVSDVTSLISRVTQAEVEEGKVEVKERMGGKYVSVAVDVVVRAPELVGMVYDELAKDPRVMMRF